MAEWIAPGLVIYMALLAGGVTAWAQAPLVTQGRWSVGEAIHTHLPQAAAASLAGEQAQHALGGVFQYALLKEYHPQVLDEIRAAAASERWRFAGAWWELPQTELIAPESLLRQVLYGRRFLQSELGTDVRHTTLMPGGGFAAAVPTIARHAGMESFHVAAGQWNVSAWSGLDGATLRHADGGDGAAAHAGELLLPDRDTRIYTRHAAIKRQNRQAELYADLAERAASIADWMGALPYPAARLEDAWKLLLWHQGYVELGGLGAPGIYDTTFNDQSIAAKAFLDVFGDAAASAIDQLNTDLRGTPIVVFNPLPFARQSVVTARIRAPLTSARERFAIFDDRGIRLTDTRYGTPGEDEHDVSFMAALPPLGYRVFEARRESMRRSDTPPTTAQVADVRTIESPHFRVSVNDAGELASIVDRQGDRELLAAPIRLVGAAAEADEAPLITAEVQPYQSTLEVETRHGDLSLTQRIRVSNTARHVEVEVWLERSSPGARVQLAFPIAAERPRALYDTGLGVIERPAGVEEVPARNFAALVDAEHNGAAIFSDSRFAWEHTADATLHLTLLAEDSPADAGEHRLHYGIFPVAGESPTPIYTAAQEFLAPAIAFQAARHGGERGRTFSLLSLSEPGVRLLALKKSQDGAATILRVANVSGRPIENCRVQMAGRLIGVQECDGMEQPLEGASATSTIPFTIALGAYEVRSYRLTFAPVTRRQSRIIGETVFLPLTQRLTSEQGEPTRIPISDAGESIPAELWPRGLHVGNVRFTLTSRASSQALACAGQTITLPGGRWESVRFIAAADEEAEVTFLLDTRRPVPLTIAPFLGPIGRLGAEDAPAFIRPDRVAWTFTHLHDRTGANIPYRFAHLYVYELRDGRSIDRVKLPDDPRVKIIAMTAVDYDGLGTSIVSEFPTGEFAP